MPQVGLWREKCDHQRYSRCRRTEDQCVRSFVDRQVMLRLVDVIELFFVGQKSTNCSSILECSNIINDK